MLTPTAWNKILKASQEKGVSVSELIELYARNLDSE